MAHDPLSSSRKTPTFTCVPTRSLGCPAFSAGERCMAISVAAVVATGWLAPSSRGSCPGRGP